jgi:DNA-binding YbaB/EbfC family protein
VNDGLPDFGALLAQAQQMQQQVLAAQQGLADERAVGTAGGGLVTATVDGRGDLLALSIAPDAFDPADPDGLETLADLVVAAVRDARAEAERTAEQTMSAATGGLAALTGSLGGLLGDPPPPDDDTDAGGGPLGAQPG